MSSNIELISYNEYPKDEYTKAICTLCLDGKYVVSFGKKCSKEGKMWWQTASFNIKNDNEKLYVDGFSLDSKKEHEKILDFIRLCEKGVTQTPTSMSEVAANDGLPF